jgi:hypothetical protein
MEDWNSGRMGLQQHKDDYCFCSSHHSILPIFHFLHFIQ